MSVIVRGREEIRLLLLLDLLLLVVIAGLRMALRSTGCCYLAMTKPCNDIY